MTGGGAKKRILFVCPHPDDETFLLGGTVARYAGVAEVALLVVTNGEKGAVATEDGSSRRRVGPAEMPAFAERRRLELLEAARLLGVERVDFMGLPDGGLPMLLVPALRARIRELDPHVIVSLSEAGTTLHPDHCWTAISLDLAIQTLLRETYGELAALDELRVPPPFALRRWFTYTLPQAKWRFDYWAELERPRNELVEVQVADVLAKKRAAAEAHVSQRHWLKFFDRVQCLDLPTESYAERLSIGASARGGDDLLAQLGEGRLVVRRERIPDAAERYSSSLASAHADILCRAEFAASRTLKSAILASGHGTRMKNPTLPKSLEPLLGRPLIRHIIDSIVTSGVDDRPIVLVGPRGDQIVRELGATSFTYPQQPEPLGTGHALGCCRDALERAGAEHVLVLYGDMPLARPETLRKLVSHHLASRAPITMATIRVPDFDGTRAPLEAYGRIQRDERDRLERIVEVRDATDAQLELREVNPSIFVFRCPWLWANIGRLRPTNAQGQLYLTDLVGLAVAQGLAVEAVEIPYEEGLGTNTREDLAVAEAILSRRLASA